MNVESQNTQTCKRDVMIVHLGSMSGLNPEVMIWWRAIDVVDECCFF